MKSYIIYTFTSQSQIPSCLLQEGKSCSQNISKLWLPKGFSIKQPPKQLLSTRSFGLPLSHLPLLKMVCSLLLCKYLPHSQLLNFGNWVRKYSQQKTWMWLNFWCLWWRGHEKSWSWVFFHSGESPHLALTSSRSQAHRCSWQSPEMDSQDESPSKAACHILPQERVHCLFDVPCFPH